MDHEQAFHTIVGILDSEDDPEEKLDAIAAVVEQALSEMDEEFNEIR